MNNQPVHRDEESAKLFARVAVPASLLSENTTNLLGHPFRKGLGRVVLGEQSFTPRHSKNFTGKLFTSAFYTVLISPTPSTPRLEESERRKTMPAQLLTKL